LVELLVTVTDTTDVLKLQTLCKRVAYIFQRDPYGSLFLCYDKYYSTTTL